MKRKPAILIIILAIIILAFVSGILFNSIYNGITGRAVDSEKMLSRYSYTRAICTDENECMDVFVVCEGNILIELTPISDIRKLPDSWQDLRKSSGMFCTE